MVAEKHEVLKLISKLFFIVVKYFPNETDCSRAMLKLRGKVNTMNF